MITLSKLTCKFVNIINYFIDERKKQKYFKLPSVIIIVSYT